VHDGKARSKLVAKRMIEKCILRDGDGAGGADESTGEKNGISACTIKFADALKLM
jgi:hypothetical protein